MNESLHTLVLLEFWLAEHRLPTVRVHRNVEARRARRDPCGGPETEHQGNRTEDSQHEIRHGRIVLTAHAMRERNVTGRTGALQDGRAVPGLDC